jgi:hypothetical protein
MAKVRRRAASAATSAPAVCSSCAITEILSSVHVPV